MENLIKYIMNEANVDYERASDCAYRIMYALDDMIEAYFEEDEYEYEED